MKNHIINFISILFFICSITTSLFAQDPPPPPGDPSTGNGYVGEGAPIDGGLGILLALAAGYGGYKIYRARKTANTEPEQDLPLQ